jgi:hypothetical protein
MEDLPRGWIWTSIPRRPRSYRRTD